MVPRAKNLFDQCASINQKIKSFRCFPKSKVFLPSAVVFDTFSTEAVAQSEFDVGQQWQVRGREEVLQRRLNRRVRVIFNPLFHNLHKWKDCHQIMSRGSKLLIENTYRNAMYFFK